MSQFIIQANDYTDEEALNRRLAARSAHLTRMKEEKSKGVFMIGGAMLAADNTMIGSVIIVSLPSEASVRQWIEQDVYYTQNVWNEVNITPFCVADLG